MGPFPPNYRCHSLHELFVEQVPATARPERKTTSSHVVPGAFTLLDWSMQSISSTELLKGLSHGPVLATCPFVFSFRCVFIRVFISGLQPIITRDSRALGTTTNRKMFRFLLL